MKPKKDIKIAIVSSSYRPEVTENLVRNCKDTLLTSGIGENQVDMFKVPGALEIPLVSKKLAKKEIYDAIIVFGAVIKGDTYHFEQVSNECIRGCMKVSYEFEIPVIFEVLSVYNPKDAIERAVGKKDNRGVEGALSALKMIENIAKI
jgi:6,7-dimethyl-8-ribityllumazine synthase